MTDKTHLTRISRRKSLADRILTPCTGPAGALAVGQLLDRPRVGGNGLDAPTVPPGVIASNAPASRHAAEA
jgi:hypothetical protein